MSSTRRASSRSWWRRTSAPGMRALPSGPARLTSIRPPSASRSRTPATSSGTRIFPNPRCGPSRRCAGKSLPGTASGPSASSLIPTSRPPARRIRREVPMGTAGRAGIGHWVHPEPVNRADPGLPAMQPGRSWRRCRRCSRLWLWHRCDRRIDPRTEFVVRAFQRHFRPERVDGRIDQSTVTTLERLIAALPKGALRPEGRPRVVSRLFRGGSLGCLGRLARLAGRGRQHRSTAPLDSTARQSAGSWSSVTPGLAGRVCRRRRRRRLRFRFYQGQPALELRAAAVVARRPAAGPRNWRCPSGRRCGCGSGSSAPSTAGPFSVQSRSFSSLAAASHTAFLMAGCTSTRSTCG